MLRFVFLALKSSWRQSVVTLCKLLTRSILPLKMESTFAHNSVHKVTFQWSHLVLKNNSKSCFWNEAFGFSVKNFHEINAVKSLLHQANTNLSASQKELLLWHQRVSYVSVKWVQKLTCNRKWLPGMADNKNGITLRSIYTNKKGESCSTMGYLHPEMYCMSLCKSLNKISWKSCSKTVIQETSPQTRPSQA